MSTQIAPLADRVEEAAAAIGVSKSTMWELIAQGAVAARKIGGATVIRHDDLVAFLDAAALTDATKRAQSSIR
ncbi:helix-turn-helix domain-containing protein [Enterovirga rhinocerotis]|uniref:Excisionase family DNA binding protein n=1 Tax=Enterovirga rhinocerotis TaxID=1339210 RepID=A0A4R7BWJ2_9HYPH|nr:helix-turn-helix domain-containing protein [Enterovirga rhinocerotis]TDR90250.1 excisionase family DNA binding protein [Enterovirga rhinocerotis]